METTYTLSELSELCGCSLSELNLHLIETGLIGKVSKVGDNYAVDASIAEQVAAHFKASLESKAKQDKADEVAQQPKRQHVRTAGKLQPQEELIEELKMQLDMMNQQLDVKDRQIESLLRQIETLTNTSKTLSEAYAMNSVAEKMILHPELQEKKSFWQKLFG